jgi:N-acetyl-anhydromuramyl-L-alanine amidase AmpD
MYQGPGLSVIDGSSKIPISWGRVDVEAFRLPSACFRRGRRGGAPTRIILHHDGALSSASTTTILQRRGLSYHFSIDNDGTIYQLVDLADTAWHTAGQNDDSIGVSLSNAFYTSFRGRYQPPRTEGRATLNGRTIHYLDFYPEQLSACRELVAALALRYGIPLDTHSAQGFVAEQSELLRPGIYAHYHFNAGKVDPVGLDIPALLKAVRETKAL